MPSKFTDRELTASNAKYQRHKEYYRAYYQKNKAKARERYQAKRAAQPDGMITPPALRERNLKHSRAKLRGFTQDEVDFHRREQEGKCKICKVQMRLDNKKAMDGEQADHCHVTQRPRGLLCRACNSVLGVYEKHQRPQGLIIQAYEDYLTMPRPFSMP